HEHTRERAAEMKTAVQEDQGKAERPKPEVPAHPGGGASYAPDGKFLTQAEQSGEKHQQEAGDTVDQAHRAATRNMSAQFVRDIGGDGQRQRDRREAEPAAMSLVDTQAFSSSAAGST